MELDHIQKLIFTDSAVSKKPLSFDLSMTTLSFDSVVPVTPLSHDSGVTGDFKLEYLGEFATIFKNILKWPRERRLLKKIGVRKSRETVPSNSKEHRKNIRNLLNGPFKNNQ